MMDRRDPRKNGYTRREFGSLTLAALPATMLFGRLPFPAQTKINSTIKGVHIGAITYSFRSIRDANEIVNAYATIGLGEMELMSNHAEQLANAPSGRTAAQALQDWRAAATDATFKPVRQKIEAAGVRLRLLCYNMNVKTTPDSEIEYAFTMAKGLGVEAISTSTQVSMAKRLAPFAEKHKMMVGFHGHANTTDPDEVCTPESFATVIAASKYFGANLDIGHYTEAGYDAVAFLEKNHARITNLHLKDKKKAANGGGNVPWGQGDTPIKEVLKMLEKNKWALGANIEFEYNGDPLVEMPKCLQYCREALA